MPVWDDVKICVVLCLYIKLASFKNYSLYHMKKCRIEYPTIFTEGSHGVYI